jgi:CRISPR-associated protein Csb1
VKRDSVRHGHEEGGGSKEGYGSIPFHRTEFSARAITAFFSVDLEQIRSYGLGEHVVELLDVLARWEIASLLDGGMRLRTACDLEPAGSGAPADRRSGEPLEDSGDLADRIPDLIVRCRDLLGNGGPIEVLWTGKTS